MALSPQHTDYSVLRNSALRYIATGKAKMRLKIAIRDKEWIPYKGCLKRFELLSLAKT